MKELKFVNPEDNHDDAAGAQQAQDAGSVLDRRTAEEREADMRLEAMLDQALAPMALVGPPGTSERAALDNGLADRIFNASVSQLPNPRNDWALALRSHRVWLSFAASMAVAVSAGLFIHSTSGKVAPLNRTQSASAGLGAEISSVDQQLAQLATYAGPSASIDREIATLSLSIDQAGSAQLWSDSHESIPTPTDW